MKKNALSDDHPHECYVVEIDGIAKFEYQVFVKALSASLQLKHDLPKCSVKLRDAIENALALKLTENVASNGFATLSTAQSSQPRVDFNANWSFGISAAV
jgi:hypothetical protein